MKHIVYSFCTFLQVFISRNPISYRERRKSAVIPAAWKSQFFCTTKLICGYSEICDPDSYRDCGRKLSVIFSPADLADRRLIADFFIQDPSKSEIRFFILLSSFYSLADSADNRFTFPSTPPSPYSPQ